MTIDIVMTSNNKLVVLVLVVVAICASYFKAKSEVVNLSTIHT